MWMILLSKYANPKLPQLDERFIMLVFYVISVLMAFIALVTSNVAPLIASYIILLITVCVDKVGK